MSYIKKSLSDGEKPLHFFDLHWVVWIRVWGLVIAGIILGFFPLSFLGLDGFEYGSISLLGWVAIFVEIFALYLFFYVRFQEYGVTNKRVICKTGIIARKTNEMKLRSIETVEIDQSVLARILGYGTVKITGQGISDVLFKFINDPLMVKRRIESVSNPTN